MSEHVTTAARFHHYFTCEVSLGKWASMDEAFRHKEPVSMEIRGKVRQVMITEMTLRVGRPYDKTVSFNAYYISPHMEQ